MSHLEEETKKREYAFYLAIVLGLIYLMFEREEWSFSFGIMWIFSAFFNAMRYRYRKYPLDWWGPELIEWFTWFAFVLPGLISGLVFLYPIGIALGSILACLIWFIFWKLWFEEHSYKFWQ